jgi:hypothetical protein
MAETAERRARVEQLLAAARMLAKPENAEGRALRGRLLETTGLSEAGIELGIARSLETAPSAAELDALLDSTPESPRAHVLLSANVFVAALRAIAIGVASSERVQVRASRRDPALAAALHALVPNSFELTAELAPAPGEHFWSYGSDETLATLRKSLPPGVWFHEHGHGIGAVVADARTWASADARAIALDTVLFDQRGCLSPRVVCVVGGREQAQSIAQAVAGELKALELELPPGPKSVEEAAEARQNRDAAAYAFELFDAGSGWVSLAPEIVIPAAGRNLHVVPTTDAARALLPYSKHLTCIGTNAPPALLAELQDTFSGVRLTALGDMQRPPLDGPVDRRHGPRGELLH